MKILLTSGGTRTAIDSVRIITNLSTGTFGNHLCWAFLEGGHDVTFLYAKGSKCPHELRLDMFKCGVSFVDDQVARFAAVGERYNAVPYDDFDDYAVKLSQLLLVKPDIVVLAAAVSDYAPIKQDGKISSELDKMTIHLEKTPKLIRKVKEVLPTCFLVGFKLLVNSTQDQLEDAMAEQMRQSKADMVVGNDLRDIKADNHLLTTLSIDNKFYQFDPMSGNKLATLLAAEIVRDAKTLKGYFKHLGA